MADTYGTPPDPISNVITLALAFIFLLAGAMASLMGSLDQLTAR